MEKKEILEIEDIWKKDGQDLIKPSIVIAIDRSNTKFFVTQDNSSIVFMVKDNTNSTFAIPKKYCIKKRGDIFYRIQEIEKLTVVSCPRKNDYEIFVQKHLIK
jgi:hypothetical protein